MVNKKKIAIVTWDKMSVEAYTKQISKFFGDHFDIEAYNVQDGSAERIHKADLYLVSTCAYDGYQNVAEYLPLGGEIVIVQVTIFKEQLHHLLDVPRGTHAMLVNINAHMATETMAFLNKIGVNNISLVPCYPGMEHVPDCTVAVTPGEARYVPPHVTQIIDVGARVVSPDTLIEIALKLRCEELLEKKEFRDYVSEVVDNSYSFQRLFNRSIQFEGLFDILQTVLDAGIIGIDNEGVVFTFNYKAEYVTGLNANDVLGRKAVSVLPFIPFEDCFVQRRELKSLLVKVGGVDINMTVTPVIRRDNLVGAFAVVQKFTDEEYKQHKLRIQLMNRGHTTKYTFEDIIGSSSAIQKACAVAKKMAISKGPVLITGESGTGKELFAHAIHANSNRAAYPFVAINCAAIPDSLLESELFGYEDGAFPGAKQGGKMGYFEFAHHGTLFLDEIGGMSPLLQLKLLRVLQEQEILHVGGSHVIQVNVRVICATNKDLFQMMKAGAFRKDLYYRLAVLPIELPPLRERQNDVLLLVNDIKRQIGVDFKLSKNAERILVGHAWEGNVRELRNCVEYIACIGKYMIGSEDLPPSILLSQTAYKQEAFSLEDEQKAKELIAVAGKSKAEFFFILQKLYQSKQEQTNWGRKSLAKVSAHEGLFLTEQEIRGIMAKLETLGLIKIQRGRGGSRITDVGSRIAAYMSSGALG